MDSGQYKSVLEFSDDIVKIIQTAINSDGGQLESRKANSMLKSFFIRQMERIFPWFKVKESKFWEMHKDSPNSGLLPNAVLPPSLDHNYAQWQEREEIARAEQPLLMKKIIPAPRPKAYREPDSPMVPTPPPPKPGHIHDPSHEESAELPPPPGVSDNRQCALCLNYGDDNTNDCGRLLYIGQNEWTHVNCALWSAQVYEDVDGSLKNVHMAVIQGKQLQCENCHKPGATVSCCLTYCASSYHFMCARQQQCAFLEDKKVYCQHHRDLIKGEVVPESGFEVTRRVLVDFSLRESEGIILRRKFLNGLEPDNIHMMIGSMTIDCLGMLTELSDCERKLFPVGYQCSRVYWSTLDARKRCVYKCRILVCCPSATETINNCIAAPEHNHTDAHNPPPFSAEVDTALPGPTDSIKLYNVPSTPKPMVYFRNRHPSYPPCHRSPFKRPLPSPDGFSSSTHEIVTVGDPLLRSSFRNIESRRHSTSSVSPQPPKQNISSPPQGGTVSSKTSNPSAPSLSTNSKEHFARESEKGKAPSGDRSHSQDANTVNIGAQHRLRFGFMERIDGNREVTKKQSECESLKSLQPASISQVSPPLGTAVLTGYQRGSGSLKTEKGKQATKDTDLPAGVTFTSSHPLATLPQDKSNPVKDGNVTSMLASKDTGKTGSPQRIYSKSGGRKSHDYVSGPAPAVAMKPLWSLGANVGEKDIKRGFQASPANISSHGTKEKHSKVKINLSRDVSKERKETTQNRNLDLNSNPKGSNVKTQSQGPPAHNISNKATALRSNTVPGSVEVNTIDQKEGEKPLKSKERFSCIRPSQLHPKSNKEVIPVEKKHTETLSLKMDPNGTKVVNVSPNTNTLTSITSGPQGPQRRSSRAMVFSPSASSESSESDGHIHPDGSEEHLINHQCADDGEDHNLEDEGSVDKHHEEDSDGSAGSAKRRYPRRSARARSNMFFGLTPFYGVQSYGEEDMPFYRSGEISMKKRTGGSKRSAEGQVDGADDMSTSSSADSGEDEEGAIGSNKDVYYYNFTRTIINPNSGLPPIAGIDQCLGRGSQIHRFLRDQAKEQEDDSDEVSTATKNLELQQIGQLDGVDDGSESDISISTSSTTTATTSSTHKTSTKRRGRESRTEKLSLDSGKEAENTPSGGAGSCNSRDTRKNNKDICLPLGTVKTQGQDPLENQLTLTTDLLKSDSDNNNSDDCGNILPSDIMEFVLNTPSMQTLGQQTEAPSTEPFSLDESYGVDVNQRKEMLFEDFTQPMTSAEPVEGGVNTSIAVEESYGLPLELPSDLSVLTTRSPTVNNQNHGSLIPETSERTMLTLATEESGVEKSGKKQTTGYTASSKSPQERCRDSQNAEGHMTPEHFIPAGIDGDHISSPGVAPVGETGNQDLTRTNSTPGLPSSPTLPPQSQKFIPAATICSGPTLIASSAVQATTSQLKPGPEKLIVLNQHLQPLYVLQTLPNGVTQKIQIAPSVSGTGVMNTSAPVLSGISSSQSIFPAGGKGLVPISHHPQIQAFTGSSPTGFQPVIPSTTSGLLIGVPSHDPQIGMTEPGHRHDNAPSVAMVSSASSITPSPTMLPAGHSKKRPISRLQSHKSKKPARTKSQPPLAPSKSQPPLAPSKSQPPLAPSKSQPPLVPSDVGPNMTLINLSPSQIAAGIPAQTGMMELGTIAATATPLRKIPNIIKRPKPGVMYLEPTLLPHPMPISTTAQPGMMGHDSSTHLLPCTVSGLNPNQSVLNVVSVPASAPGNFLGASSVSLSAPSLNNLTEITGPISNLLIKANTQNLGLPEQQVVLHSGNPMMSQLTNPAQTSIASSICVFPPNQSISMSVNQQVEKEGSVHFQNPVSRVLVDKTLEPNANLCGQVSLGPNPIAPDLNKGRVVGVLTQSSRTSPISQPPHRQQPLKSSGGASSTTVGKGKQKTKRPRVSLDKTSVKKRKGLPSDTPTVDASAIQIFPGDQELSSLEPMDTGLSNETASKKSDSANMTAESSALKHKTKDIHEEKQTTAGLPLKADGKRSKAFSVVTPDPRDSGRDSSLDYKTKKGLIFEICSDDGFQIRCESIEEAWKSLTDKVQEARSNARLKTVSFDGVNGLKMLGVVHDAVVFLLEQLYGARHCRNYRFRFHKPEKPVDPPINPHGSARAEVYNRRSVLDMFNFLASKHRQPPEYNPQEEDEEEIQLKSARRATSIDLPLPMRIKHLKKTSREAVGVYRSAIHGRGLFCRRNIDVGEMVIEYSGNVIRSVLTDKQEKYYDGKAIGCYMFRIDDYEVVDATMHGNAARFINHSCEPNCYSRVVSVNSQKHIVIFAMRKIYRGEELTYDYKFPIEEPGNKLPCNCGAKKCRKFLN